MIFKQCRDLCGEKKKRQTEAESTYIRDGRKKRSLIFLNIHLSSGKCSIIGCTNDAEAEQLMDACNGDVAMAVDLYFQQRPAGSPDDPQCSSSPSVNRHNTRSSRNAANVAGPSKQRRIATFNGSVRSSTEKEKRRKHEDDDDE